jgi:hypothetical protein
MQTWSLFTQNPTSALWKPPKPAQIAARGLSNCSSFHGRLHAPQTRAISGDP